MKRAGEPTISETISDNPNSPRALPDRAGAWGRSRCASAGDRELPELFASGGRAGARARLEGQGGRLGFGSGRALEAHREPGRWSGRAEPELRAWLRRLLVNKIAHATRRYRGTGKRQIGREVSLAAVEADSALAGALADDQTSPGGRAARNEEEAALCSALERLPERMHRPSCGGTVRIAASTRSAGGWAVPMSSPASSGCALQQLQVEMKRSIDSGSRSG